MKTLLLFPVILLTSLTVNAQSISNVKAVATSDGVQVTYDLTDSKPVYVSLHYSKDGGATYSSELKQVFGDVRERVQPGIGKKIDWNANAEIGPFEGELIFKVEASATRMSMPKPVYNNLFTIEIIDALVKQNALIIDFKLINTSDKELIKARVYPDGLLILDREGVALNNSDVRIANKAMGEFLHFSKDVGYKGTITVKDFDSDIQVLSLVKIDIGAPYETYTMSIKNIPVRR